MFFFLPWCLSAFGIFGKWGRSCWEESSGEAGGEGEEYRDLGRWLGRWLGAAAVRAPAEEPVCFVLHKDIVQPRAKEAPENIL